jgi:hypothetical protein
MHRTLRSLPLVIAAASLLAPAAAHAGTKKAVYPAISSVAPLKAKVGGQLTIKGSHFRAGAGKTTVVFQRSGKPAIFVKATTATTSKLTVRIPEKLATSLVQKKGAPTPTQFKLRVLTTRFARSWTTTKTSPTISPKVTATAPGTGDKGTGGASLTAPVAPAAAPDAPAPAGPAAPAPTAYELCQAAAHADPAGDTDGDGLSNGTEIGLRFPTDPCNADSDDDGATDGYEYNAAKDLNGDALPYPGSQPWPNPLDPIDINDDFDGDGLTLAQEFHLWKLTDGHFPLNSYSDGNQNTGGPQPITGATADLDLDGDGNLTDDERDADHDGLSNETEFNYTGTQAWWNAMKWWRPNPPPVVVVPPATPPAPVQDYVEAPYTARHFSETDAGVADSDGDGILDGADDQDNDGVSNIVEMQYSRSQSNLRVQPFNPCLPNPHSLTCGRYIPLDGNPWPPFDGTQIPGDAIPFGWNGASTDPAVPWDSSMTDRTSWDGRGGPL